MFDIFRKVPHGVLWMGTANDEEEVRETVKKLHAVNRALYFALDDRTQAKRKLARYYRLL